ncbi:hypothetical protein QNO09_14580 [Streptomyces sp. 378]|nr:hypothetical protein [Streptomyces sp. 378]MDK1344514.1 hypothetical protein [Streptomyces sp. 378]
MTCNPLEQRSIPLDRQLRSWRELDVAVIDPDHWTRTPAAASSR